jgi:isopentenyl-diphosphate delta-isomerase
MDVQQVILVNEQDEQTGVMEKIQAHREAMLHRAFSVFIFNSKGEMLLQQRAGSKYHSPGLWSNACCSHPAPGEETQKAAERRVAEELGIAIPLQKQFHFTYKAEFDNGLTEYEYDHVYTGHFDTIPDFNTEEVQDCCFKSMKDIKESLQTHSRIFTEWFKIAFPEMENWWLKNYRK